MFFAFTRYAVSILIIVFFNSVLYSQKEAILTKKFSSTQLKQDAKVLKDALLKVHPVIGIYQTRPYCETLLNDFINSLTDSLTEKQFRIKTKVMLGNLHCAHTEVSFSKEYSKALKKAKLHFSRYHLMPFDNKVYVMSGINRKKDTLLKQGTIITKINGVPADSFQKFAQKLIPSDGYIEESKKFLSQIYYGSYYTTLLNYPDTLTYEYIKDNKTKTIKTPTLYTDKVPEYVFRKKDDSLFTKYKRAKMRYRYLDNNKKTMHLNIQSFSHRKYGKAYKKIFKQLKRNNTENLIIDLRYNTGGSLANCTYVLRYLLNEQQTLTSYTTIKKYPYKKYTRGNIFFKITKLYFSSYGKKSRRNDTTYFTFKIKPLKKWHYNTKIIVLTNGVSYSASCLLSAYLKETKRAVFIGRETGGTIEGCNAVITPHYKLPNTKIKVRIPAFRLLHDVYKKGNTGTGILPDYETNYTIMDIIQKRDLEMEKVMELIKN